ncbi:hypothetical protein Dsin_005341 [Dipteronia sinensis]|uniref:Uncharacterized protein n=1 Tax=Dipteronia sinensis TaxID=43782 RepID=A0AAE0AXL0_9ROSI|nr:hypothetical protein Dsin_005341 [Dipteronia sinensis]
MFGGSESGSSRTRPEPDPLPSLAAVLGLYMRNKLGMCSVGAHCLWKQAWHASCVTECCDDLGNIENSTVMSDCQERLASWTSVTEKMKMLDDEIVVLMRALNNPNTSKEGFLSKIKVPEPKQVNHTRNAKELKNFLWDIEQFLGKNKDVSKQFNRTRNARNAKREQMWAQAELRRQGVKDISSAMAATEGLVDF